MFPGVTAFEARGDHLRHTFQPSPEAVTVERDLRRICGTWQDAWTRRMEDELDAFIQPAAPGEPAAIRSVSTVEELVQAFSAARSPHLHPATIEKNRHYLNAMIRSLGATLPITSITEGILIQARTGLLTTRQPSSVNCIMAVWKSALTWGHRQGHLAVLPHTGISKVKEPKNHHAKPWWTPDEIELAFRCAAEDEHQPTAILLVALGCLLGLRYEEIVMQRWEDIALDARSPDGANAHPVLHVVPHDGWQPKDGEARTIPIPQRLAAILTPLRQRSGYLLQAVVTKAPRVKARKEQGKRVYRYDPAKVWDRIIARVVAAGGRRITPHGMRHSFASNLLTAGVSDVKVAHWLGHADTSLLHERYGHLLSYDDSINAVRFSGTPAK